MVKGSRNIPNNPPTPTQPPPHTPHTPTHLQWCFGEVPIHCSQHCLMCNNTHTLTLTFHFHHCTLQALNDIHVALTTWVPGAFVCVGGWVFMWECVGVYVCVFLDGDVCSILVGVVYMVMVGLDMTATLNHHHTKQQYTPYQTTIHTIMNSNTHNITA